MSFSFQICPAIDVAYFLAPSTTGEVTSMVGLSVRIGSGSERAPGSPADPLPHHPHLHPRHPSVQHFLHIRAIQVPFQQISLPQVVFFREDYKNSLMWGFNFAVGALPNVLAEKEEDVADMEEFFSTTDKEAFEELMKKEQEKVTKSDAILDRLGDLWDEMVEAGVI